MTEMDPLTTSLIDLLYELREHDLRLIIGGGFGLFLKRQHLAATAARTVFEHLPSPRATNDIDLFLRAEVLANRAKAGELAKAIKRLAYEPIPGAELFQWRRSALVGGIMQEMKLDILVGPLGEHSTQLHFDSRRARPRGKRVGLHAHPTEEALAIEDAPIQITVQGTRSNGEPYQGTVYLPRTFPYLLMKLHAFRDRMDDADKDLGRHHALDLYTIIGIHTEGEYEEALGLGRTHKLEPHVVVAREIVNEHFSAMTTVGLLRLREHQLFRPEFAIDQFVAVLAEVFQV
jgi:hypothetical protein